jgi:hypothetical protein
MTPQPIVGVRRRTKPRLPLFGFFVEGHRREDNGAPRVAGSALGARSRFLGLDGRGDGPYLRTMR